MAGYQLTVRAGPRVQKERYEDLAAAIDALREQGDELSRTADTRATGGRLMRKFEPVQQVVGRVEVKGPGVRCGVDIRGDGSAEAFTGRLGRTLVHQQPGESPYEALARELGV
jgi:uncharacterized protein YlxW (UPF0749 family)